MQHAAYAIGFQILLGLATGNFWLGCAFGIGFFLAREVAQVEYKITKGGSVKELKPWEGFNMKLWGEDNHKDLWPTVIATPVVAYLAGHLAGLV
jgi:hypothetical protein